MRGRKPNAEPTVIPMRADAAPSNMDARAEARLAELRPVDLAADLVPFFDRLALPLCHPTRDRLDPSNVFMFVQLCRLVERQERLTQDLAKLGGETYEVETRNGKQRKTHPEVGQLNEVFRQIRSLAGEFGMTPATNRSLQGGAQIAFDFDDDAGGGYFT